GLKEDRDITGYKASFIYKIFGKPLRGSLYPPRAVLYRHDAANYVNEGHGHRAVIAGRLGTLRGAIFHDVRKSIPVLLASHQRYAKAEAAYLLTTPKARLSRNDRIRLKMWLAPSAVLFYVLIAKGAMFDGWPGWAYALQRVVAEALIAL